MSFNKPTTAVGHRVWLTSYLPAVQGHGPDRDLLIKTHRERCRIQGHTWVEHYRYQLKRGELPEVDVCRWCGTLASCKEPELTLFSLLC